MTQLHLTQCPNCQHQFSVTDEQLALKSGFARCENCHKIFSAIDYVLDSRDDTVSSLTATQSTSTPSTTATATTLASKVKSSPKTTPKTDDDALLFDDHSGLDEDGNPLIQPTTDTYQVKQRKSRSKTDGDFELIDNFDQLTSTAPVGFAATPAHTEQDDESWLTDLLAEDQKNHAPVSPLADKLTPRHQGNNDVTSLLDELGVDVTVEQGPSDDEYLRRVSERFERQTSSQKQVKTTSTGMNIIWAVGSLLLLGLLAAQYVIFNADEMLKTPDRAANLQRLCQLSPINCNLPNADLSLIDSNVLSLERNKTEPKKTDLIMTLTNKSSTANLYPNLKITLRAGNETKAQFIVPVKQYAPTNTSRLMGNQIKPLKFRIDYPRHAFDQASIDLYY